MPAILGQFPYQASIEYNEKHRCGAVIFNPRTLISAAHCFENIDLNQINARAGFIRQNDKSKSQLRKIKEVKFHPDYQASIIVTFLHRLKM